MSFLDRMAKIEFIDHAFIHNFYLWVHALGGNFFLALFLLFGLNLAKSFIILFLLALAWEIAEFAFSDVKKIYGSLKFFIYNAIGDVLVAMIAGLITSINHWR